MEGRTGLSTGALQWHALRRLRSPFETEIVSEARQHPRETHELGVTQVTHVTQVKGKTLRAFSDSGALAPVVVPVLKAPVSPRGPVEPIRWPGAQGVGVECATGWQGHRVPVPGS